MNEQPPNITSANTGMDQGSVLRVQLPLNADNSDGAKAVGGAIRV